jgi:uncharacterized membrane protein
MPHSRAWISLWPILAAVVVCNSQLAAIRPQQSPRKSPPKKILYFEGLPRPEMKFIRRATYEATSLRVVTVQRTADGKYLRFDVDGPSDLANGFPSTREELFKYQGVILGSADASVFTADQQSMLADFVTVRGGGLLALGGEQSFAEGGWLETPVSYLLPIAFDPNRNRQSPKLSLTVNVQPTDEGIDHPALRIADDKQQAARMWQQLPPVTIVNAVYPRPSTEILLTGADRTGREQVVLAVQQYGAGRVVAFTPQDSWVWVMHAKVASPAHERFWRALLAWLVESVS